MLKRACPAVPTKPIFSFSFGDAAKPAREIKKVDPTAKPVRLMNVLRLNMGMCKRIPAAPLSARKNLLLSSGGARLRPSLFSLHHTPHGSPQPQMFLVIRTHLLYLKDTLEL